MIGNDEFEDVPDSPIASPVRMNGDQESSDSFDPDAESDSDFDQDNDDDDDEDDDVDVEDDANHNQRVAGSSSENNAVDADLMEADSEDEVLQRIIAETKKQRDHPPDIKTDDFVFDLCFHPVKELLAVGTFAGK